MTLERNGSRNCNSTYVLAVTRSAAIVGSLEVKIMQTIPSTESAGNGYATVPHQQGFSKRCGCQPTMSKKGRFQPFWLNSLT